MNGRWVGMGGPGCTGTSSARLTPCSGFKAGAFGGVALFTVIYYASGIPRVQDDILKVRGGVVAPSTGWVWGVPANSL